MTSKPKPLYSRSHYRSTVLALVTAAYNRDPFQTACAILRLDGMSDADWDPFEQSEKLFDVLERTFRAYRRKRDTKAALFFRLLIYCQAVEMTTLHCLLWNLLNISQGLPYKADPFAEMARERKMKKDGSWIPLSATDRYREIASKARALGFTELGDTLERFFSPVIRNAISHWDFVLRRGALRTTEGGYAKEIPAKVVRESVDTAIGFIGTVLETRVTCLKMIAFSSSKQREIAPGVFLKYLAHKGRAVGFEFRNADGDLRSQFLREKGGVKLTNIIPQSDETFAFSF